MSLKKRLQGRYIIRLHRAGSSGKVRRCEIRCLLLLLIIGLATSVLAQSNLQEQYLVTAEKDYKMLRTKLPSQRQDVWDHVDFRRTQERSEWIEQWKRTDQYLRSQSNGEELVRTRAFSFLREFGERQLRDATYLVEGVGAELLAGRLKQFVTPELGKLRTRLETLRSASQPGQMTLLATELFDLQAETANLQQNPPVKERFQFAPPDSPYDRSPAVVGEFILHDWANALERADQLGSRLRSLDKNIAVQEFLRPRDPNALISLVLQLASLLIAVAGYMIRYTSNPSVSLVAILVICGMGLSLSLAFISSNTLLNIVTQSIVPGIFILWWSCHHGKRRHD